METTTQKEPDTKDILNINVGRIIMGLTEIGNLEIEDFDINMGISKTIANLSVVEKAYQKTLQTLMKKHIEENEKGNLMSENGFYVFKTVKDKNDYQTDVDKLNDTVVTEKVWSFNASELKKIKGLKGTTMAKVHELIIDDRKDDKK